MEKECFLDLGRKFYEWHKNGNVQFIHSTEGKNQSEEIATISKLIEYVTNKKSTLLKKQKEVYYD